MKKLIVVGLLFALSCTTKDQNWPSYLGDEGRTHFSTLSQINKTNATSLQMAWTYASGDADASNRTQIQCNPLIVDGLLYGTSPTLKLFSLDAGTGKELWAFDPFEGAYEQFGMSVNRGLEYWTDGADKRLYFTAGSYLYAVDAANGAPLLSFGDEGKVDLKKGLDRQVDDRFVVSNSPGVIYKDKFIVGTRVSEDGGAAPGHIRAYNIHTGERDWIFHTIPHPGEFGYESWPENAWKESGGANAWAGMSLDIERGIVYIPTGSASYDFYGADRPGDNLFANSLLALHAETGERIWHFQTIHHDLWDKDLPAPPVLSTITVDGNTRDVVIQITKMGFIYVLDRETGEHIFPVEEREVPPSSLPNEIAASTQPQPSVMPTFARQIFNSENATNLSDSSNAYVKDVLSRVMHGDPFIPPSEQGTVIFPGYDGGGEWGGPAFNPDTETLFVNANEMPWILTMIDVTSESNTNLGIGKSMYTQYCAGCHGADKAGGTFMGNVPSLQNLSDRMAQDTFKITLANGRGAMPSFAYLYDYQVEALKAYIFELEEEEVAIELEEGPKIFRGTGYNKFYGLEGYPAIEPPWGTLTAVDIANAKIKWQIPLGEHDALTAQGISITGTENYGGPVATKSGLLFIAATQDERFRVIDQETGDILFEADLPAAGYATPSTYSVDGKQFVVVACGGGKLGTKSGDQYVAFALP